MRLRSTQEVVMEDSQVAAALLAELARRIGPHRFELWFTKQARVHVDANGLTVRTASTFIRDLVIKNLGSEIRASWEGVVGQGRRIELDVDGKMESASGHAKVAEPKHVKNGVAECVEPAPVSAKPQGPKKALKENAPAASLVVELSAFVVGASNEYAFRSADLTGRG